MMRMNKSDRHWKAPVAVLLVLMDSL